MLNFTCSLQAKFYAMSSITRPCSVRLFVNICKNKGLFDNYNPDVGDKCIIPAVGSGHPPTNKGI